MYYTLRVAQAFTKNLSKSLRCNFQVLVHKSVRHRVLHDVLLLLRRAGVLADIAHVLGGTLLHHDEEADQAHDQAQISAVFHGKTGAKPYTTQASPREYHAGVTHLMTSVYKGKSASDDNNKGKQAKSGSD
eukprot:8195549-Pyramimonas_sp.AAC.1